jgi:hypothetical protein
MAMAMKGGWARAGRAAALLGGLGMCVIASPTPRVAAEPRHGGAEIQHAGRGHEVHISGPALAVGADGQAVLAWFAEEGPVSHLYVARPGAADGRPVRVDPEGRPVASIHQPPGLAMGSRGEIYLTWPSPRPDGGMFSQDLLLSRSLDGGRSFEPPLRVSDDRPGSHSFEGIAVAPDGSIAVAWIESREGDPRVTVRSARVDERGRMVRAATTVGDAVCVCCRVDVASGPPGTVALTWRKVFPGDVRDMVLSVSRDGGDSFAGAMRVHADGWKITACPHRGGVSALDGHGRIHVAWYTEARQGRPDVLYAVSDDGRRFSRPTRIQTATGAIPDNVRLAVDSAGRATVVWEERTAVRQRVLARHLWDRGQRSGPVRVLSQAIKAYAPDVRAAPDGALLVAWNEERFPHLYTVVRRVEPPRRP